LDGALGRLAKHPSISVARCSRWSETSPVGGPSNQPRFLNGAAVLQTSLPPEALLTALSRVEVEFGRQRHERWGPRSLDLDLLLYDQLVIGTPSLVLPHPRMAWRRFVLEPAAEVAGDMLHPAIGWTVRQLLDHLNAAVPYVAISGSIGAGKTHLARALTERIGGRLIAEQFDEARLAAFYANPPSHAWQTELEFLRQRARLLAAGEPHWADRSRWTISDFWFDQSPAFAKVWLPPKQWPEYCEHWQQCREGVVRPKLVVVLDVVADVLLRRVARRGRPYERGLDRPRLQQIGRAIVARSSARDQGPVLRLTAAEPDEALDEVTAAVEAMQ